MLHPENYRDFRGPSFLGSQMREEVAELLIVDRVKGFFPLAAFVLQEDAFHFSEDFFGKGIGLKGVEGVAEGRREKLDP